MPYCFEFKAITGEIMFLEVVNTCTHHFTGEKMRYVRIHGTNDGRAEAAYMFMNEAEWEAALVSRVKETKE